MISTRSVLGIAGLLLLLGSGTLLLSRRPHRMAPPPEAAQAPFTVRPAGAGLLLTMEPPAQPLRAVRWVGLAPGGSAVVQLLSQTGHQEVALLQGGQVGTPISLPCPQGVAPGFFGFAELVDAVLVQDQTLILLYRGVRPADLPLLVALDLATAKLGWFLRAPASRLTPSADQRHLALWGSGRSFTLLPLEGSSTKRPVPSSLVELPAEVGQVSSLLQLGSDTVLLAHTGGLSAWRRGTWTHQQAPPASFLGFSPDRGMLAASGDALWWQPEPGMLLRLEADGIPGPPVALAGRLPESLSLDAALLQLLGVDASGQLWFALARPPLEAAHPAALAQGDPVDRAVDPTSLPPAPGPSRESLEAHLRAGLERVYCWKPGAAAMRVLVWSEAWKQCAPPAGLATPSGTDLLRPDRGALLLGSPDRLWQLPLKALQPR